MKIYRFTVPDIVGKQRPYVCKTKYGAQVAFTPKKTRNFEALVKMCARQAGVQPMGHCRLEIIVRIPYRIKKFKTKPDEYLEPLIRPDLSNIEKAIEDALTKIAYSDDKYVIQSLKRYEFVPPDRQPECEVILTEVEWTDYRVDNKVVEE